MSSVAELGEKIRQAVEAEADEAEVEEDEETVELEPEPEPEPEPAAIGEAEIKKAEAAVRAQRKRLAGILGDAFVAHECLFCSGLGFTPEPPPVGVRLTVIETADGLTFEAEPPPSVIPLKAALDKSMCSDCEGYGEVLTGSKAPHGMVAPCGRCNGNGWVIVPRPEPGGQVVALPPPPQAMPTVGMIAAGTPDAWGRPAGHQHWGVPPAQIAG